MNRSGTFLVLLAVGLLAGCGSGSAGTSTGRVEQTVQASPPCTVAQSGDIVGHMRVDRLKRTYVLHVPRHLSSHRHPLVIMFHGSGGTGKEAETFFFTPKVPDHYGLIAVYPDAYSDSLGPGGWVTSRTVPVDYDFTAQLIRQLSTRFCVDTNRIYVAGFSLGAVMTFAAACYMGRTIAAFGAVSGFISEQDADGCHPRRWAPIIAIHGTMDSQVPYASGNFHGTNGNISSFAWTKRWAKRAGCTAGPHTVFGRKDVTAIAYTHCKGTTEVQMYTVHGGVHAWPGSGYTLATQTVDASEVLWQFFAAHPLR